jgi:hypothetical protein
MGGDAADRTHIPATQDSSNAVAIRRRCNLQSDPKSDFGQVQTRNVTPEALAILPFQKDPITNKRETYRLQNQTAAVAPEALAIFSNQMVPMRTYAGQRRVTEHNQEASKIQSQVSVRSRPISLNEGSHNLNRRNRRH